MLTMQTSVVGMDAGELREWLAAKYAFGFSSAYVRTVAYAERRMAALLGRPFHELRQDILEDARAMREDA